MNNNLTDPIYFVPNYEIWVHIPGFNGYEISNYGGIRSYKHYKTNPRGDYIKVYGNGLSRYVIISDNSNKRKKMFIYDLMNRSFNTDNIHPHLGTYYRGYNKLKDIPDTREEREKTGYGSYNMISDIFSSNISIDIFGNTIN